MHTPERSRPSFLLSLTLAAIALPSLSSCNGLKLGVMRRGFASATNEYFADHAVRFDRVADGVHSYRAGFDRNLVLETSEGMVVVDPFSKDTATALRARLAERWPGRPVTHLIYSHYHLDHVRGGAVLAPREVIAHRRCPDYWADLDARGILPPTRLVEGDVALELGGVPVHLVDLGKSHTDTLYAIYLPRQKVLFAADLVLVKAFPPVGMPDIYRPGFLRAIERVSGLPFETFVPSHFDPGTRADFLAGAALYQEAQRLVRPYAAEGRALTDDAGRFNAAVDSVFDTLYAKYGDWQGGGPALLQLVQRTFVGEFLGF